MIFFVYGSRFLLPNQIRRTVGIDADFDIPLGFDADNRVTAKTREIIDHLDSPLPIMSYFFRYLLAFRRKPLYNDFDNIEII